MSFWIVLSLIGDAMSADFLEPIMVGTLSIAAAAAAGWTVVNTLEALRAKLRARAFLYRASLRDAELHRILTALEEAESLSQQEMAANIAALERRLSQFSPRDRAFLNQGLHQSSVQGVRRFAKELATAY